MISAMEMEGKNGVLPIRLFLTADMLPDEKTKAQLVNLATSEGLQHYVAVLPDIHHKSRNLSPTGSVVVSKEHILPRAVDNGINCGMRMMRTEIQVSDLTPASIESFFHELKRRIPVKRHEEKIVSDEELALILADSGKWAQEKYGLSDSEINCIEEKGRMPTSRTPGELLDSIPEKALKKGGRTLGTLGAGNHFLELQEVAELIDEKAAQLLGLSKGQAFFMLHTGSRGLGKKVMTTYLEHFEKKFAPVKPAGRVWAIPAASEEGRRYAGALSAASNFGFANRIAITEELRAALRSVLDDESVHLPLLYDCAHVSIKRETWRGETLWVHRHGASRALPPSYDDSHPIYSRTGQPVPVPGSMGHDSYICVAADGAAEAFCSVNHGAGRVLDKPEAMEQFSQLQIEREMRDKKIRLFRYGTDNIAEQAPRAFKNISRVIDSMTALGLARPVARLRPVAVLKG